MSNADINLSNAKRAVTAVICDLSTATPKLTVLDLAARIDDLNAAWDKLTDILVAQRNVRDETIEHLHYTIANMRVK